VSRQVLEMQQAVLRPFLHVQECIGQSREFDTSKIIRSYRMDSLSVQKGYQIIVLIGAEDSAILTCKSSDRWPQRRLVAFWPQN
jgi:hypothetical protein